MECKRLIYHCAFVEHEGEDEDDDEDVEEGVGVEEEGELVLQELEEVQQEEHQVHQVHSHEEGGVDDDPVGVLLADVEDALAELVPGAEAGGAGQVEGRKQLLRDRKLLLTRLQQSPAGCDHVGLALELCEAQEDEDVVLEEEHTHHCALHERENGSAHIKPKELTIRVISGDEGDLEADEDEDDDEQVEVGLVGAGLEEDFFEEELTTVLEPEVLLGGICSEERLPFLLDALLGHIH
mmetsp:Transcript_2167/g.2083  ORF Transcript_2167/g.2083 Transcript_2167/m.2083 type:complete len:238 (+) Transcript_2167:355-1068(+)